MTTVQNMYAEKHEDGPFTNIYLSEGQVRMCGAKNIVPVAVSEHADGTHYGWKAKDEDGFCMIWQHEILREICFAYGMQAAIDAGQGVPVRLKLEEII